MNLRRFALIACLLLPGTALARERPVVLELFTSQGCSSCPPAEKLLGEYAGRADVLPLGFHVTYWNRLGWRDTFSFEGATQRQAAYESRLGSGTSFTPQMVIDGRTSAIGSRREEVAAAIRKASAEREDDVEVALSRSGGGVAVRVGAGRGRAEILLVGFDRARTTPIGRGENGGRTITQSNVVRSLRSLGPWTGRPVERGEAAPEGEDAAVILQAPDGRILGAARL
jgi:hypothetical protein